MHSQPCSKRRSSMACVCRWRVVLLVGIISLSSSLGVAANNAGAPETVPPSYCADNNGQCAHWASQGHCLSDDSTKMQTECRQSCGYCTEETEEDDDDDEQEEYFEDEEEEDESECEDDHDECEEWAEEGECSTDPDFMLEECRASCFMCIPEDMTKKELKLGADMGVLQEVDSFDEYKSYSTDDTDTVRTDVLFMIHKARTYMNSVVDADLRPLCKNRHALCSYWAFAGECTRNPTYMHETCAPACHTCHMMTIEGRCPIDPSLEPAWKPGAVNAMFRRITTDPTWTKQYNITTLSSPELNDGPWVILVDDFVTPEETQILIDLGGDRGYARSADVGSRKADGTFTKRFYEGRTSTNAWCQDECLEHPVVQRVQQRMSVLTGIPEPNSEHLQLLRYEKDQFYKIHHDYIPHHVERQHGARILTVYLYLNDVEEGGGTNFNELDLTVQPKRGRAVLWPSVLDEDPHAMDERTHHQALPVIEGMKYGANAWFHQYDFKTPNDIGCT